MEMCGDDNAWISGPGKVNLPEGYFILCLTQPEIKRQIYGRLYKFVVTLTGIKKK